MTGLLWRKAKAIWARMNRVDISLMAAGVAFFGFLAIFPALAAVIAIWGIAFDPHLIQSQLDMAREYLPPEAYDLILGQVTRLLSNTSQTLGLATIISTIFAIWSARAGVGALIGGLNSIHHLKSRSGFWSIVRALVLTLVLVGLVMCAMALAVITPVIIRFLPLGPAVNLALTLANFALGVLLVTIAIALTYWLGPNWTDAQKGKRFFSPGLLFSIVMWAVASRGFVFYLVNFNNYNQVYGSIGAVVALLLWFYISAYVVLVGAAIDAEVKPKSPMALN